jgi:hypothetical protein
MMNGSIQHVTGMMMIAAVVVCHVSRSRSPLNAHRSYTSYKCLS